MLSVKQGGIKYHFLSLWNDSTWDWTQVSWAIGEHSNRLNCVQTNDLLEKELFDYLCVNLTLCNYHWCLIDLLVIRSNA